MKKISPKSTGHPIRKLPEKCPVKAGLAVQSESDCLSIDNWTQCPVHIGLGVQCTPDFANMAAKMNHKTALGSRIAEVHNGSSLFTGDAGQGESNIRRWIVENDWLEAIVALPLNLFYNTGIATYIWVLSNRKPEHRQGKVQLIDASGWFKPLRKNLGKKNCELAEDDIKLICDTYLVFAESEQSKIFPNAAFGYWKATVERPLRLHSQLTIPVIESLRFASGDEEIRYKLYDEFGDALFEDLTSICKPLEKCLAEWGTGDEDGDDEEPPRMGLSEKKKEKTVG